MWYFLSILFSVNLVASVFMVRAVFPLIELNVRKGGISNFLYWFALFGLTLEGAASGLSFFAVYLNESFEIAGYSYNYWLLALYAFANFNVFLFVSVFHARPKSGGPSSLTSHTRLNISRMPFQRASWRPSPMPLPRPPMPSALLGALRWFLFYSDQTWFS
jgi:ABC-type antimicrobial peptide transport system permease subunit